MDVPAAVEYEKEKSDEDVVAAPSNKQDAEAEAKVSAPGIGEMYKRIFKYASAFDWVLLIIGATAAIASGTTQALVQVIFGNFVQIISDFQRNIISGADFNSRIGTYALRFVYLFLGRFAATYIFMSCYTVTGLRISRAIRYDYFKATLSQEVAFFDGGEGGSVTMKVTTNGNQIQQGISDKLAIVIQSAATCVACIIVALVVQWKLALVTLTILPAMVLGVALSVGPILVTEHVQQGIFSQAGTLAEDVLSSVRNVQAFWMRPKLVARYDEYLVKAKTMGLKQSPLWGIMFSTEYFAIFSGFSLCFYYGVKMFARGEIDNPGPVVVVLFSAVIASFSLTSIAPFFQAFVLTSSAANALFKTIDRQSSINPLDESGIKLDAMIGDVTLEGIDFAYPTRPDIPVLQGYSITAAPGKVTALVGPSGCGKSTIVGLLERWYNPLAGTIKIDGHPIESFNLTWLRTKIRLVQQEPVLLNGTVFQNVVYGLTGTDLENAPREEQMPHVIEACKMAFAHDFVSELPEGYDTNVGERAGLLSGGQKQRIAIARALISNPKILLLDEATSALDPNSEGIVQQALDRASVDRTTLVIAHKLATIRRADKIVVMQKGQIIEQGTHDSLLALDNAYAKLVGAQALNEKAAEAERESDDGESSGKDGRLEMERTQTSAHAAPDELSAYQQSLDYEKHSVGNLGQAVWYVLREQAVVKKAIIPWVLAILVAGATFPAQGLLFSNLIDVFSLTGDELVSRGNRFALYFFVVALGNLACYFTLGWISNVVGQNVGHFYRKVLFDVYLQQDIQFYDRAENTTGAIASRLSTMPTNLFELFGFNLSLIFMVFINLTASSILALAYGWKLALILVFAGLPPQLLAGFFKIRLEVKIAENSEKRFADSASLAGEAVAAIRTISSLAMERRTLVQFGEKIDSVLKSSTPFMLQSMVYYALSQSVEYLVMALGFWYGCRQVGNGEYSLRQFFVVFISVFFAGQAAGAFFSYATAITKGTAAVDYIKWLRALKPIVAEKRENQDKSPPEGPQPLSVNDIGFVYPTRPADRVIKGISITAKPGSFIALVGGSGSGKSTVVSLLERFYDPASGTITIGPEDISQLNPRSYRSHMSLVQQEPTLYQGTVRENVALGAATDDAAPTEEEVSAACDKANISEFVRSLPEGLDTAVGSRGLALSGGQRQRLAIARALLRDPKILLLDEATSALDTESERVVQHALSEAAAAGGGRITVAVAHRLSTIKDADCIFVMVRGKVVESGSHAELVAKDGVYADMVRAQSLDREV